MDLIEDRYLDGGMEIVPVINLVTGVVSKALPWVFKEERMIVEERVRKPFTTKRQGVIPRQVKFKLDPKDARSAPPVGKLQTELEMIESGFSHVVHQGVSTEEDLVFPPTVLVDTIKPDVQASAEESSMGPRAGETAGLTNPVNQEDRESIDNVPADGEKTQETPSVPTRRNFAFNQWVRKDTAGIALETAGTADPSLMTDIKEDLTDVNVMIPENPLPKEEMKKRRRRRAAVGYEDLVEQAEAWSSGHSDSSEGRAESPPMSMDRVATNIFKFTLPPISKTKQKKSAAKPKKHSFWSQLLAAVTIQTWWRKMRAQGRKTFSVVVHAIFDKYLSESVRFSPKGLKR